MLWLFFLQLAFARPQDPWWKVVERVINNQTLLTDACITVGRDGRSFDYCIGNTTLDTVMPIASSSKIVSAMPFYELLVAGKVKRSDKVSDYLDYWTTDPSDSRSGITLFNVVSFQTGYDAEPSCMYDSKYTLSECVKHAYENVDHTNLPGTFWAYNEFHLQILGAVLEVVLEKPIEEILADTLSRYNMSHSQYTGGKNPVLAATLETTGNDYEQFWDAYFNYRLITVDYRALIESAYNVFPEVTTSAVNDVMKLFVGHYGMTMWWECPMAIKTRPNMDPECALENVHSCPGLMGYWPLVDRTRNYWMQVVTDSGPAIGCIKAQFFRLIVKPFVDAAMEGRLIPDEEVEKMMLEHENLMKQYAYWSTNKPLLDSLHRFV